MSPDPEPDADRLDRNWNELLQELRVTQTGVQLLSGFLLTVPFSDRFTALDGVQRATFLTVFAGSVLATTLLVAPVAFHRVLFRRHRRLWLVEAANICARAGLAVLALTTSGVLFLVFDLLVRREVAVGAGALTTSLFVMLWLMLPVAGGSGRIDPGAQK
jgi:hypothetical protein